MLIAGVVVTAWDPSTFAGLVNDPRRPRRNLPSTVGGVCGWEVMMQPVCNLFVVKTKSGKQLSSDLSMAESRARADPLGESPAAGLVFVARRAALEGLLLRLRRVVHATSRSDTSDVSQSLGDVQPAFIPWPWVVLVIPTNKH